MHKLLEELCYEYGISGSEDGIRNKIENKVKQYVDEIYTDNLGNLICKKNGTGKKVMLCAHMDEIGLIVTHIDKEGFLRFSNIGGVSPFYSVGQRVRFENGVIGTVFYESKLESMKDLKVGKMYIDIGAESKEEAMKKINVGDGACFESKPQKEGDVFFSKALDDRVGCAILIEAIKKIKDNKNEIYFVFTVQEEVGLRGARTSAYGIIPDYAVGIDVTGTGDTPNCNVMDVKCGQGPAIKLKDNSIICHKKVVDILETSAKSEKIPYQMEILEYGGTDPGAIHVTAGGVPSGAISIPCRYIHSPNEMINLIDVENAVKLLVKSVDKF